MIHGLCKAFSTLLMHQRSPSFSYIHAFPLHMIMLSIGIQSPLHVFPIILPHQWFRHASCITPVVQARSRMDNLVPMIEFLHICHSQDAFRSVDILRPYFSGTNSACGNRATVLPGRRDFSSRHPQKDTGGAFVTR